VNQFTDEIRSCGFNHIMQYPPWTTAKENVMRLGKHIIQVLSLGSVLVLLAACGGGGGGGGGGTTAPPPAVFYTVGGTVSGLTGSGLVLRNNGGNDLVITGDGPFTFTDAVAGGGAYSVSVATQATNQNCTVSSGSGAVNGNITNVAVTCFALQSVVFQRAAGGTQGDLYLVKEDGSGTVPLTITTETERYMFITPAGKIVFERGFGVSRDVYIVNADGTGEVLLASNAYARSDIPSVTPGGRVILSCSNDLCSVNADGTGLVQFGGTSGTESFAGIAPSGKVIFLRSDSAQSDDYTIRSSNADGTGEIQISPVNTTEYEIPLAITPVGRVIFQRAAGISSTNQRDLFSVNEDGAGLVTLANDALSEEFVALIANERVVYVRDGELYSVRADGTGAATLTSSPDVEYFAAATPDGKVIYRRSIYDPIAQVSQDDIYIINGDGTGLVALAVTPSHEQFAGVTLAGQILYARATGAGGERDLYLVNADGTGEFRLTNTPEDEMYACSPVCTAPTGRLIFNRAPVGFGQTDILSINPDGTGEVLLANTTDYEYVAGITVSSRVIYIRDRGANQYDLYSINADGTDLRTLADTLDSESFVAVVSP
jgi:hypothetical protein